MKIEIQITQAPIVAPKMAEKFSGSAGAFVEFSGTVRDLEAGEKISALEYEAYSPMAENEIRRILKSLAEKHPCLAASVIHRIGVVPVGEAAIYFGVVSKHRGEALAVVTEFMHKLKQDVPIWKVRALAIGARLCAEHQPQQPESTQHATNFPRAAAGSSTTAALHSLKQAFEEIQTQCQPMPAVNVPLAKAFGRVLRETVCAPEDLPPFDCSTRDGFAILADDNSESFQVVDTIHAAGWQPRQLRSGEAVRVATGAPLPCSGLRVVMQENVRRDGDRINIIQTERAANIRRRGEDVKAGQPLVQTGARLDAGKLALLATAGCVQPLMSPHLRVLHFTTGDEIVPPAQTPKPGQIRDSNSSLIFGLLQKFTCNVKQKHLPENFEAAWGQLELEKITTADLVLISGGASVGDKDFTRPLLERLGFQIHFAQVNIRPGKPLIFGTSGSRVAFGLPGNPLSHFVCFHLAVAAALARMTGEAAPKFLLGKLAAALEDKPNPRETLWPARWEFLDREIKLHPLAWASSGDVTCFANANALIRVPVNQGPLAAGAMVEFLPTDF